MGRAARERVRSAWREAGGARAAAEAIQEEGRGGEYAGDARCGAPTRVGALLRPLRAAFDLRKMLHLFIATQQTWFVKLTLEGSTDDKTPA